MAEIYSGKFRKKINFAQVSNIALRDENLSLKAKGLYSLIQSYITLENFDLYKNFLLSKCKEGEKAFESGWNELKINGYLKQYKIRVKEIDVDGKVLVNNFIYEYELLDSPNLDQPSLTTIGLNGEIILKNEENIVVPQNGGCTNNVDLQKVGGTNCGVFEKGVSINTIPKNNLNNNIYLNQSINQEELTLTEDDMIDEIESEESYEEIIAKNIELEIMKNQYGEFYEEIYNIIIDAVTSDEEYLRIDKKNIPTKRVIERFLKLNQFDIECVISKFNSYNKPIKNEPAFLLTCLYNSLKTTEAHAKNQANYALYGEDWDMLE